MKAECTKGKWWVLNKGTKYRVVTDEVSIADVFQTNRYFVQRPNSDMDAANAKLIAAAPDLLAACEDIVSAHDKRMGPKACKLRIELARAAIDKAKGK
ncbi:MAG: hypothetical protein JRL30_29210 [Deltaproteobacteria bacterium]|nr:hypothetical protein [Deltaproteobacteria bacterium]